MSEHHFAVTTTTLPRRTVTKRDRIAREVGGSRCGFVQFERPGGGTQAWGFGPNRGDPFDRALAAEIKTAWEKAGV